MESSLYKISEKLKSLFSQHTLDSAAEKSSFIQRSSSKINPLNFLILMVLHMTKNSFQSLTAMTDILANLSGGVKITPQGLSERLGKKSTLRFLRRCYSALLRDCTGSRIDKIKNKGLLCEFHRVFIEDSTSCQLHQSLATSYKGTGGSAYKAGYKVHLTWEALTGSIHRLETTASSVPDQSTAGNILPTLKKGDLVIRDLAYFALPIFNEISERKAFFLSRMQQGVKIYTVDGRAIEDMSAHIDKHYPNANIVELNVLIGSAQKLPVRLIAYRCSSRVLAERLRKKRNNCRKRGTTLSKKSKHWVKFSFFITNVPEQLWKASVVGTVYRIRWDIEMVFKSWKSQMNIHIIKGKSKERVECFIVSRLIAICILNAYFSSVKRYLYDIYAKELSMFKFISWVLRNDRFLLIASPGAFEAELIKIIKTSTVDLCKQKRSRRTTLELLETSESFFEGYLSPLKRTPEGLA